MMWAPFKGSSVTYLHQVLYFSHAHAALRPCSVTDRLKVLGVIKTTMFLPSCSFIDPLAHWDHDAAGFPPFSVSSEEEAA